jgi:hypothetical protein
MFNDEQNNILNTIGIKVFIKSDYPVVCETLERIGIINHKEKKIYPSCYCYKTNEVKDGKDVYVLAHFKELFLLQGKVSTFNEADEARLKTISYFLDKWGVVKVCDSDKIQEILQEKISVLPYKNKYEYTVVHKFKNNQ